MKTKYIKIPVSERLPEKSGNYNTDQGELEFSKELGDEFYFVDGPVLNIQWWLEEVPDHSEEMLSMLEEIMRFKHELRLVMSEKLQYPDNFLKALTDAEQLINKVKDNGK